MKTKKFVKEPLSKSKLKRLIALVNGLEELNPKSPLEAIEMSLAKWHPSRGKMQGASANKECTDSCGCCSWFIIKDNGDCVACPLKSCNSGFKNPYSCWEWAFTDEERERWANIIHYILLCAWNIEKGFMMK